MSLRRCYHAHGETYNPHTRGTRPSPCAAPTTPAHAESPEHTPSRAAMQPRMPTPKPPEHSTPQHTAPPQESPMVTHCPAKHHAQAAKGAATQSNTTTRPRRSTEDPTQTSENSTAHKPGPQPQAGRPHAPPLAGTLYKNFHPNRLVFSMNEIVASIIILFVEIFRLSLPYKSRSHKFFESMSVISKSGTSAS